MAVEDIGVLVPTKIPGLADAADIQEALRVYHYGGTGYEATAAQTSLPAVGIARRLLEITDDITSLENRPSSGGDVATTAPVAGSFTPSGIPNGYIWVDGDSAAPIFNSAVVSVPSVVKYQNTQPTTNLQDGMQWVDKDDAFLTTYVYNQGTTTWIRSNQIAKYQTTAPTGNIVEGSLWVDKGSTPLKMYVYDATDLEWKEIGA